MPSSSLIPSVTSCPSCVACEPHQACHSYPGLVALQLQPQEAEPIKVAFSRSQQNLLLAPLSASVHVILQVQMRNG